MKTNNKYHARKCEFDGELFDSLKEKRRWQELLLLEKAGKISNLRRQVKYTLIPAQREVIMKNGRPVQGKVIERECNYIADFSYFDNETKSLVVEDVKGGNATKTKEYIVKRKLMLYTQGIRIKEV